MTMVENVSDEQISDWVGTALVNQNIDNYKLKVIGMSDKGEGYATDVVFVTVTGNERNGKQVEINLVLKIGKDFKIFDQAQIKEAYIREMFVYDRVFPEYKNFQLSKNQQNTIDFTAKCVKTLNLDRQIIIFENLRKQGYEAYDRQLPMNIDHIKIVLKNYALFHAIGFAYKDQKKLEFEDLTNNYTCTYKVMTNGSFRPLFQAGAIKALNAIKNVDGNIANKLERIIKRGVPELLDEFLEMTVDEAVIIHGDCWSSNFLFKYEGQNKECPTNVAILDWQMSNFTSPMIDLSYFMLVVSSETEFAVFDELLDYYYANLSENISELGSDPAKLYPRSIFLAHWKLFSTVGFLLGLSFMDIILCDKNDAPVLSDCNNEGDVLKIVKNTSAKNKQMLIERILSLSRYYFNLQDN